MNIIIYRYGNICEPDVIDTFRRSGIETMEITEEITDKQLSASRRVELVSDAIREHTPAFVFSINFFPAIAKVCHLFGVLYLCWTVDSPVLELFSESITYDTNRIFLFDRAQYDYFHRFHPNHIFHLPLAACTDRFDKVLGDDDGKASSDLHSTETHKFYAGDISFVGSLYSEKNPLNSMTLSEYSSGYLRGLSEASLKLLGYRLIETSLNAQVICEIKEKAPGFFRIGDAVPGISGDEMDRYVAAHAYAGYLVSEQERILTLNTLAEHFHVDLYTRSDTTSLRRVHVHGGVKTLTEMPQIFRRSAINLNMTICPIQTGLPLRIFDILGCGGFLMTNFQEELPELFDIGTDCEAYSSLEELVDKCGFYLEHEDLRKKIARNGYEKVKRFHCYEVRLRQMLEMV